ncbi:MAG: ABC transporter permease [Acetobacter sp.]|nr:ABC transporter permease [Acetobacter sp.]
MAIKLNISTDDAGKNEAIISFQNKTPVNQAEIDAVNYEQTLELWKKKGIKTVYLQLEGDTFSTVLAAEAYAWGKKLQTKGFRVDFSRLPTDLRDLLALTVAAANMPPADNKGETDFLTKVGTNWIALIKNVKNSLTFIRDMMSSVVRFFSGKAIYRKKDFWFIFADCSYKAVGIVALVSFLVGLILAFVGALQLKTFGAGIYVASMVTLGMTRIMAAIMVGIIMAGRTGSSFAATLGTMQVNEEIDALKTFGIKITDYLVTPRMICLVAVIPFLTMLADVLGILGGAVVGVSFLDLTSSAYFEYSIKALELRNILVGLLHSLIYGVIIAICGCYEGLNAGRDADSVGKATTGAVVTSLVWMIVATGILTVILEELGI